MYRLDVYSGNSYLKTSCGKQGGGCKEGYEERGKTRPGTCYVLCTSLPLVKFMLICDLNYI